MKSYNRYGITILFIFSFICCFLSTSAAQDIGGEELFSDYYGGVDYDEGDGRHTTTIYVYSRGLSATVNNDPQLSNGKVTPEVGDSSTQFYYSVDYSDTNEDVPATIGVYIDGKPSSMTLDAGVAYNGTYKSSAVTLGSGTHTYYFTTTDGDGGSARLPESGSTSGPTVNDDPVLSDGGVVPSIGTSSTKFYYKVIYYDLDEDPPSDIYMYIDGTPLAMTLDSGVAYNGTYKSLAITLGTGTHTYYFTTTDGDGNSVRLPVSGNFSGPTVNDPPQLSGGKVVPDSGSGSTDFYYYVDYYDGEEDVPETPYVYIDNVAYVMSLYNGKDYNGTYRYGPKLLKAGSHNFYFTFSDGYNDLARLPTEGSYSGPEMTSGAIYVYDNIGGANIILDGSDSGYTTPATLSPVDTGIHKVALLKDDYVSLPSYAIVEVAQETVEVPFILLSCPVVVVLEDDTDDLRLLRNFRDSVLNQTDNGKEYINLYYTYAPEVSLLIINDSDVKTRMEKLLHRFIPLLTQLMEGEMVIILPSEMKDEMGVLLNDFEAKGSPFLKAAVKRIRKELDRGKVFEDVGFEVEGDSFQTGE